MGPPSAHDSTLVAPKAAAPAEGQRTRAVLNRFIFRAMLFSMGSTAVVLHRTLPWKSVAWDFAKFSARNLARLCGVRVHVYGLERLAGPGPYIFAPNHQSNFDIAALLGYLPGHNRFVTKKELFAEPVLGTVLRTLGMVPVDRENPLEAIQLLEQVVRTERCSLIIFPEGTRSRDGALLPFKKGPFAAAILLKVPVVPVVCRGTAALMPKGGYLTISPGECEVFVEEPIPTADLAYDDRTELRDRVRALIATRLGAGTARPL
jgi:1-acyl-sn-glycerol-3-phosphate acyltransferase